MSFNSMCKHLSATPAVPSYVLILSLCFGSDEMLPNLGINKSFRCFHCIPTFWGKNLHFCSSSKKKIK